MQQTINGSPTRYVLDPAAGLTQVLADGTNTYLYGNARLGQYQASTQYFGADGLGSVRQLYDSSGQVVGSTRYDPYGNLMAQSGATSVFAFAGEQYDATGLQYLRARYYSAAQGRFTTRDTFAGDDQRPLSLNKWNYVQSNPINFTDPSGRDLMLVGGVGTDDWNRLGAQWKLWIRDYKGWSDDEVNAFYRLWESSAGQDENFKRLLMSVSKVHIFNWGLANSQGSSDPPVNGATIDTAKVVLWNEMQGMEDITVIGHSKGGNLVLNFLQDPQDAPILKNAVIIDAPSSPRDSTIRRILEYLNCKLTYRAIPWATSMKVRVVNIYNTLDPANDFGAGPVGGAWENLGVTEIGWPPTEVHSLKGNHANEVLNTILHVATDRGAQGDGSGRKVLALWKNINDQDKQEAWNKAGSMPPWEQLLVEDKPTLFP